jgi:Ras-related protein Rab-8A
MALQGGPSRSNATNFDLQIKLLMIGDSGVGKTCLLLRYANDSFSPTFITTIGIDFKIKTITLDDKVIKLQIWDTAGQERFRTITTSYFRGAQGILLVYDVTDRGSFENIQNWVGQIQNHAENNISKVLIGNKCDVDPSERTVSYEEGKKLAQEFGIEHFFEASAKQDTNVKQAFEAVAKHVKNRLLQDGLAGQQGQQRAGVAGARNGGIQLDDGNSNKGGCACAK